MKRAKILIFLGIAVVILEMAFFRVFRAEPGPPNIVLISIDTLRGDYFSPEYMPNTFKWARENCAVFPKAYSNSTWTSPSHVTMLSGLLQSQHKVDYKNSVIPPDITFVQEELREAGYETIAFTGGGYISEEFGFDRGFDFFADYWMFFDPKKTKRTFRELREDCWRPMAKIEEKIHEVNSDRPLFLFAHTYFVHEYFLFNFDPGSYPERPRNDLNSDFVMSATAETKQKCYEAAVRELDVRLDGFIQKLLDAPIGSNIAVIITSDHGEGLGDRHGEYISFAHAHAPYSDQVHVPLIVYGIDKGVHENLISLKDIPGIIKSLAGLSDAVPIPSNDVIVSEYIQYDKSLPPEARTVAMKFPDKKFLLDEDGSLFLFTDETDSVDVLSMGIQEKESELSEKMKEDLRALGYLN